ncbi:hypothetical protein BJ322DRAFT_1033269 [Thelephora terrestris]|uniref:BZIP domain-containing protein n=1 Tax=Thelephora terrestris TaxID=56493 RepID=A0A9P6HXD8_9AGAM|nr:hypothetical protein BJ322DRAFT_1033269 [Thelephora terrestris]
MPPSNVQGLNEIDTTTNSKSYSDSRDLLNFPDYSGFNAQLDLWTTISFESDDHLLRKGDSSRSGDGKSPSVEGDDDETSSKEGDILYPSDAHENVVTGIPLPTQNTTPTSGPRQIHQPLDLASLLTSFGVNPLGIQLQQQLQQQLQVQPPTPAGPAIPANMPALAQLLSLPIPTSLQAQTPIPASPASDVQGQLNKQSSPPKRIKVAKSSTDTVASPNDTPSEYDSTPLNPTEDKRRRNTAASARFRLKKKEREAALEKRAKELETKVSELEKECEGLRRENGWLKGLVVGVTGVAAPPQLPSLDIRAGSKRQREDDGAVDR